MKDNTDGLITVIIPVYKVEQYIRGCIESVRAQTYKNIEILLVDDGSPDGCGGICDEYARTDTRVRVIHKENGGLSDARNAGLEAAEGAYIGFVDADDRICADMYEKLMAALLQNNADIAAANFMYVDGQYEPIETRNEALPLKDEVISGKEAITRLLDDKGWYYVTAWNKLYKKSIFANVRFPAGKLHEDEFVAHMVYSQAERVACISDVCYLYAQREGSIMDAKYSVGRLDVIEALAGRFGYCIQEPGMREYCARLTQRMYAALLEAYEMLDRGDKAAAAGYARAKRIYLQCCGQVKRELGMKKWFIDVIVFRYAPAVNAAAARRGRRWRTGIGE